MPHFHPAAARRLFTELAHDEIDDSNLARGALLIALEEYPQLDVDECLGRLDAIAERVRARVGGNKLLLLDAVLDELFHVEEFHGDAEQYYDARNSYLNEVIDRKIGIPITLSVIFLHVAHRVGLEAAGVGLPGHYVVKARIQMSEIYIDPFHGGNEMTVSELAAFLHDYSGGRIRLESEHLRAWGGRETLVRVLTNLQNLYARNGDAARATAAAERAAILLRSAHN